MRLLEGFLKCLVQRSEMNIVFLQEGSDPNPDPNSICVKALVEEYRARGENVYIVCDGCEGSEGGFSQDTSILHVPVKKQVLFSMY